MKTWFLIFIVMWFASTLTAEVSLSYGSGEGRLTVTNPDINPKLEEILGPLSFRAFKNDFFVVDSLAGRILRIGSEGNLVSTIKVSKRPAGRFCHLQDMALLKDASGELQSVLVLDAANQEIIQLTPEGKTIRRVGGVGNSAGKFVQLQLVEAAPDGSFAAADVGREVLALFTAEGKLVREVHWEWSGFCFDPNGNICYLRWDEAAQVNHLVVESLTGTALPGPILKIGPHTNPTLWSVNKDGEALISYHLEGFKGPYKIALCDATGNPKIVKTLIRPSIMNRYLESDSSGGFYLASADYGKAPKGTFRIRPFSLK